LALAIGRARLGRGGVVAFERRGIGEYRLRLVTPLPLEPSAVAFDEGGALLGYAEGFVFRVADSGVVENLHYVSRNIGKVSSITKSAAGIYYLGLECGVLRLVPADPTSSWGREKSLDEEWWSAARGEPQQWASCTE
jgi:hypothetical protein